MLHPDVKKRGCTRLEISLYACDTEDLSQTVAEELIAEALELANTKEGLFVVQPPAKQWENLAQHLDRCMLLGDRPLGSIYLAWGGHSKTGRVQGMLVKPTAATVADDVKWERAMHWVVADFGLKDCLIFHAEIVGEEGREVLFSALRCYTKVGPTYHSCSKQQAVRAALRHTQPKRSTTANKACRMGLENKKNTKDWDRGALMRADGSATNSRRKAYFYPINKKPLQSFVRAGGC